MNIWEWLTVFGFTATILGVFLTIYGMINNKTLKTEAKGIRETITEFRKETVEILAKMDQRHEESRRAMAEVFKKMDNTLNKIDDTQRYIVGVIKETQKLIVAEGEKTREAIRI